MSLRGPSEVFLMVDGYDLLLSDVTGLEYDQEAGTAQVTGLGTSFRRHAPTGLSQATVALEGTLFDDGSGRSREALDQISSGPSATDRIFSLGMLGTSIGAKSEGFEGAVQGDHKVLATHDDLQRVAATFQISGARDPSAVLHPLSTETADGNTQSTSVDNGSSSTGIGTGYFQLNSLDASNRIQAFIQESSDDIAYADLISFTVTTSTSPTAERTQTTSGVERYAAARWDFTTDAGSTSFSAAFHVEFSRA